jgi:DNA polymerase-3 subunit gamma/tau
MQIASISFDGEKKKSANYIIPATFFQALLPSKKQLKKIEAKQDKLQQKEVTTEKAKKPKPVLKIVEKRRSSLSLKSIHDKKEEKKSVIEENYDNHPKTPFTEDELITYWKEYTALLIRKGEKSMASIIGSDTPKLAKNFIVSYSVPNKQMQEQFARNKPKLLGFLRQNLNNYGIDIKVKLNETIEKKFAYTPQEKYNKLREKNPLLDKLRQSFELDL